MNGDKKYHITLGIMIFLFIIIIAGALAVGLGAIELNFAKANYSDDVSQESVDSESKVESSNDEVVDDKAVINSEKEKITAVEKNAIEEYIGKIYKAFVTPIPNFDDINKADDNWCFGTILVNYLPLDSQISTSDIVNKAKEVFGSAFNKQPSDIDIAEYDKESDTYVTKAFGMPGIEHDFKVESITKEENKYVVNLVEWIAEPGEDGNTTILSNIKETKITTLNGDMWENTDNSKKYAIENKEKFTLRKVLLEEIDGKMYIKSCSNI